MIKANSECSLKECLIVVGILSGYLASYLLIDDVGGWRTMYGLSVVPALALLFGMVLSLLNHLKPSLLSRLIGDSAANSNFFKTFLIGSLPLCLDDLGDQKSAGNTLCIVRIPTKHLHNLLASSEWSILQSVRSAPSKDCWLARLKWGDFLQAWLPESPRWLVLSGAGKKAAQESIQKLRGGEANPSSINAEVDSICTKTKEGQKTAGKTFWPVNHVRLNLNIAKTFHSSSYLWHWNGKALCKQLHCAIFLP